jgi:hypothetical protein
LVCRWRTIRRATTARERIATMISWVVLMVLLVKRAGLDFTHMIDRTERFVHGVVTPFALLAGPKL